MANNDYEAGRRAALELKARREKPAGTKEERLRAYAASHHAEAAKTVSEAPSGRGRSFRSTSAFSNAAIDKAMTGRKTPVSMRTMAVGTLRQSPGLVL